MATKPFDTKIETPFDTSLPKGATSFYDFSQINDWDRYGMPPTKDDVGGSSSGSTDATQKAAVPVKKNPTGSNTDPDEAFQGTTIGDVEDFLKGRIEHYKSLEESDEDRKKRERSERRYKNLAAIGDILGSFHKAYSHSRGVDAMELPSISERAQERIDKARKEREKNTDMLMNYVAMLDKLNSSKAQSDYQQKSLDIKLRQQERLEKQEETNRSIAEAKMKLFEAQSNKNDEQAAYWKTKAELLEQGFTLEQAEKVARIKESEARAAKLRHDANAPYGKGGGTSSGGRSGGGGSLREGTVKVTEKTDATGRKTTTRTYIQPRRQGGNQRSGGSSSRGYANTKKLGL